MISIEGENVSISQLLRGARKRAVQLTVLAVNSTEAWWTLADITNEGVAPVGLTDLTCSSVVARVRMARACEEKE